MVPPQPQKNQNPSQNSPAHTKCCHSMDLRCIQNHSNRLSWSRHRTNALQPSPPKIIQAHCYLCPHSTTQPSHNISPPWHWHTPKLHLGIPPMTHMVEPSGPCNLKVRSQYTRQAHWRTHQSHCWILQPLSPPMSPCQIHNSSLPHANSSTQKEQTTEERFNITVLSLSFRLNEIDTPRTNRSKIVLLMQSIRQWIEHQVVEQIYNWVYCLKI